MNGSRSPRAAIVLLLGGLSLLVGCGPRGTGPRGNGPREAEVPSPPSSARQAWPETPTVAPASSAGWETWFTHYLNGERIGYGHQTATPIDTEAGARIALRQEDRLTLRRGQTSLVQTIRVESLETVDGQPLHVAARVQSGDAVTRFEGNWQPAEAGRAGGFTMTIQRGQKRTQQTLAWQPDDAGGPLAVEQSLRDAPLAVGETRIVQALLPVQGQIGTHTLKALGREATPWPTGPSRRLTKIEVRLAWGDQPSVTSYQWVDDAGRTQKTSVPSLGLTSYRSDRATATAAVRPQRDLLPRTFVPFPRHLPDPRDRQETVFRLVLAEGATQEALSLPTLPGQTVRREADGGQRVTVRAGVQRLDQPAWSHPTAADSAAGPLIDYQAPAVQALLDELPPAGNTPRATALELTGWVHRFVARKDFSQAFAAASEVATNATGDCTEHAVLLAALLRARGIPTRVAAGLVYLETREGPAMGYHMWDLAYVDGGWLALDATLGEGAAAADRIALVTDDLARGNAYGCLLPVLSMLGQFRIE